MNDSITTLARKNQATIRRAISATKQTRIADVVGVSEATISRFVDNDADRVGAILAAAGLKCVPSGDPDVSSDYLRAVEFLASERLAIRLAESDK